MKATDCKTCFIGESENGDLDILHTQTTHNYYFMLCVLAQERNKCEKADYSSRSHQISYIHIYE